MYRTITSCFLPKRAVFRNTSIPRADHSVLNSRVCILQSLKVSSAANSVFLLLYMNIYILMYEDFIKTEPCQIRCFHIKTRDCNCNFDLCKLCVAILSNMILNNIFDVCQFYSSLWTHALSLYGKSGWSDQLLSRLTSNQADNNHLGDKCAGVFINPLLVCHALWWC